MINELGKQIHQNNMSKYSEVIKLIITMDKHMAEQYMRHDYRSMYEIWEMVSNKAKEL